MNQASQQRFEVARSLAAVYASHPDVQAIILGGSTARGTANAHSDIDLGLFWTQITSQKERSELMRQAGGVLNRGVDNRHRYSEGNPRRQGCIELIDLQSVSSLPPLKLDIEHETVAGTQQVLSQVVEQCDPSLEKQELLSVIASGIVLYGHKIVARWQEKTDSYPEELAQKMVSQHFLGIGNSLLNQLHWFDTQDWFCLYEGLLDIERRLLLTLAGLNRRWVFTDNPGFKGMKSFAAGFTWQPDRFVNRLGQILQCEALVGIVDLVDLSEEIIELIESHLPAVNILDERLQLNQVRATVSRHN